MTGERYVDVMAEIEVHGKQVKVQVWVDLVAVARLLGPRAMAAKSKKVIDCHGAVIVRAPPT